MKISQMVTNFEDFFDKEVYIKLWEAEQEMELDEHCYSPKEVLTAMLEAIGGERIP